MGNEWLEYSKVLKYRKGAGKMAGQQEMHLLCKLKDWSFYPRNLNKSCVNVIVHLESRQKRESPEPAG